MPEFQITVKATFLRTIIADHEDAAWEVAEDLDPDDMSCTQWEVTDVTEIT